MSEKLTEQWLAETGFKCSQEERQPQKHWRLLLGWGSADSNKCIDGIGIELSMAWWLNRNDEKVGNIDGWHCWIISHSESRKIIHVRYIYTCDDVIRLVESLTGEQWNPENHLYGNCYTSEIAERLRS